MHNGMNALGGGVTSPHVPIPDTKWRQFLATNRVRFNSCRKTTVPLEQEAR